jgi:hypothetical protein
MGDKEGKWLEHLKAAEASDLTLNSYAKGNQIGGHRRTRAPARSVCLRRFLFLANEERTTSKFWTGAATGS